MTRRSQDVTAQEEARQARNQTLLRPGLFTELNLNESNRSVEEIINEEYAKDSFIQDTLKLLQNGTQRSKLITLSECEHWNGRLYYRG